MKKGNPPILNMEAVWQEFLFLYQQPALAFCDFLANALGLQVRCTYTMPGRVRAQRHYANWKGEITAFDDMGNRLQTRGKPNDGA